MSDAEGQALIDSDLVRRAAAGDRDAFGELVTRHQASVFRFARVFAPAHDDVEDVLQQTFLSAWQHIASFRGEASVRTWLLTIARNAALARRAQSVREGTDPMPLTELGLRAGWGGPNPEELAMAGERADLLSAAWARLEPADREVLTLRELEGFSGEQTASMLGVSLPAMKSRLHRARMALAVEVKKEMHHAAR